jgi:hypothetical protein
MFHFTVLSLIEIVCLFRVCILALGLQTFRIGQATALLCIS